MQTLSPQLNSGSDIVLLALSAEDRRDLAADDLHEAVNDLRGRLAGVAYGVRLLREREGLD